ncbi:MBL fold metallo-hydrolase [Gilvimarinus sp. SDUM040013]|uniref:MBL fold metallo-hydrolase n=1 Tax=Gilvimarinus gilvus TaxID=3058038 RepID=A0ABU4RZC3_9GAMM|nr:MBL fold metallo-hydrolase [Gilvimarinus sp. SDUM040013]MDO3384642.1 MBL fold metallo-hydrolase [Gilvimarinus sp. SDUM040013]MDX6850228.1 MBL fold metallo-hydrolase [Gilvimarinus sp. SDUM040013]
MSLKAYATTLLMTLITGGCTLSSSLAADSVQNTNTIDAGTPARVDEGKFLNHKPTEPSSVWRTVQIFWRYITESRVDPEPTSELPMKTVTRQQLDNLSNEGLHIIKLGHSSLLLKVVGEYWLIDPVFSERASPVGFMGPKRFQPTPISLEELPPIAIVLISHNHYDHLDKQAVESLADKAREFLVPLGVDKQLLDWGIAKDNIQTFDWWQSVVDTHATITFTPAQHFSGRGLQDTNESLWGSWVIETEQGKLFFSGDSGYFPGFKTIGDKFGPFDLTFIETGAYNDDWPDVHMTPEQSVQAHIDLNGKVMMPIHNGTFNLAFHPWYEPLNRVSEAAAAQQVELTTPVVGEVLALGDQLPSTHWWQSLE